MFRRIAVPVVLCALALASCAGPAQEVPTETFLQGNFRSERGPTMRYLVWLPDGYGEDRDKRYPMIVFLHGSGDTQYDSEFVVSYGLPAVLQLGEQPDDFDFVVISPQAAPGSAWWTDFQVDIIDELVADSLDTYLVDPGRVYLTGLSMGGYGSWYEATAYPQRYAAVVSTSGSAYSSEVLPPAEFTCRLADVPVWGIHGERDDIADYALVESTVRAYERMCDTTVKWTSYPDAGHFETYERAYRDPALYDWMRSHSLSG
jgi:predicted peptidase